jgi:hypothetical protein
MPLLVSAVREAVFSFKIGQFVSKAGENTTSAPVSLFDFYSARPVVSLSQALLQWVVPYIQNNPIFSSHHQSSISFKPCQTYDYKRPKSQINSVAARIRIS